MDKNPININLEIENIKLYLLGLQNSICAALEKEDGKALFHNDNWEKSTTSNSKMQGSTRIISNGNVIEKGGVSFSKIIGNQLPISATEKKPDLVGCDFQVMGISVVMHPHNPFVPTSHMNIRFFYADRPGQSPVWWFGGGYDLTPYYPFEEDCIHWHKTAALACAPFGEDVYYKFKRWCDNYFYLKHRNEARGIGGIFFDDLNEWPFATCFKFIRSIGNSYLDAYLPIISRRKNHNFSEKERNFQLYRRGRYVEFNLIYDRGTLFGLQSNGRIESILMSLPPLVSWKYNWHPDIYSLEESLCNDFLRVRDWV